MRCRMAGKVFEIANAVSGHPDDLSLCVATPATLAESLRPKLNFQLDRPMKTGDK